MRFSCWRILFNDPKPFLHYLQVKHCTSGGSWSDGVVLFQRLPVAQQERQDVYRLRVVGREIQLLEIHYCARGLALAPYRVFLNSTYHFEVRPPAPSLNRIVGRGLEEVAGNSC